MPLYCLDTRLLAVFGIVPALSAVACAMPSVAEIRALPVPATAIQADDVITSSMLAERLFRVTANSLNGFATEMGSVLGKQARRRLIAGKPIPLAAVGEHMAVRRGMSVAASYEDDGFSISSRLIALEDAKVGSIVNARNVTTGAIVRALVRRDGSLLVESE